VRIAMTALGYFCAWILLTLIAAMDSFNLQQTMEQREHILVGYSIISAAVLGLIGCYHYFSKGANQ